MLQQPIPELSILNKPPSLLDGPKLLHELVPTSASDGEPAIDFLGHGLRRELSYESLHALSNALARRISHTMAKLKHASAIIPVFLPQCPELYVALLAILKAGKAFCPLSLDTPDERLEFILDDLSAELVITDVSHHRSIFRRKSVQALLVGQDFSEPQPESLAEESWLDTENLAYVLYTSGSTGLPKAVSVSHRAVTQSLLAHNRHLPDFRRFLQFAAPTFDVAIFEIFFPLFRGRTLVGCTRERLLADLPTLICDLRVDAAELTPTVVTNLLQGRQSVPGLKLLLTIGEMLTRHVIDEFGGNASRKSILWGMYGPTEAAIHCTLQPSFPSDSHVGNIGFPLDTVSAFVVAPSTGRKTPNEIIILPVGEVGELVLGGPQIAVEYFNRPELTASSFVRHKEFGLLYRTGDKARVLPNGTLECLGRITSGQVKIRGQRVELGEIEQAITKVDGCQSAVASVIQDDLVAFCAVGSRKVTRSEIMDNCRRWLPSHMIPTDIILVPSMPQLPSGKVDRKALETQYFRGSQSDKRSATWPSSPIHRVLQDVLNRDITMNTPLSSLGLDSLRSIRIASMLRKEGYNLGATDVLSAINLEELVAACNKKIGKTDARPVKDIQTTKSMLLESTTLRHCQDAIADIIPCTPLQEAMLAETVARPDTYCNWVEIELSYPHTYAEIRKCLDSLGRENETLRSGFLATSALSNGTFAQVIWKHFDEYQIKEVTSFSRRYTLASNDSLLRPLSIQINTSFERPRLLFQIHHALYDGWSFDLISRDLRDLLDGKSLVSRPQYRDVVQYFSETQKSKDASVSYWTHVLKDYHPSNLPNFNGKLVQDHKLLSVSGRSSVSLKALFERAQEYAINPQVYFQAAVTYMVGSFIGSTDVVIGTVTSGRTIPVTGIEDIIGPCIASLPLRTNIAAFSTIKAMLQGIQHVNRAMLPHCTLPLRDIVKICGQSPARPLFDVLFVWQESLFKDNQSYPVRVVDQADQLEFKITLEFEPRDDHILYRATYDPAAIPETQVTCLFNQIDELVGYFLSNGDYAIDTVAQCFSPHNLSIANPAPICKQFQHGPAYAVERWASDTPEKEALLFGAIIDGTMRRTKQLTYAALNMQANQLAHALLEQNVDQDALICVLMEKSVDLYVSILAVLKLGCGYLPLTPDTPVERINKILREAKIKVCISDSSASRHVRGQGSCIVIDIDNTDLSRYPGENLDVEYDGSHLAYAIFTSGSTGTPKGVLVTQDNLMSNLDYLHGIYPTSSSSRLLQACSQAFDVSVFEIFFTWYAGMCLCASNKDDLYCNFEDAVNRLGITHLSLTPTVASLIDPSHVPKVTFLVTAGEGLTEHVRRQWAGKGLYQGYGPSETTNICTVRARVTEEDLINNIGTPFKNTSAFVMEPGSTRIVPRGGVGELCFGGAQVFRGYMNMPDLNAEKIINHARYGRIYRSGDMGMLLPDDSILFTGRSDDQVKIRGQRVELGDITSKILDLPDVEDCVTLLYQTESGAQRLVVFWMPADTPRYDFGPLAPQDYVNSISSIFDLLTTSLPAYMVPSHAVPITQIPLTAQSKVDKRLLLSTYKSLSNVVLESISSHTPTDGNTGDLSEQEVGMAKALADTIHVPFLEISRSSSFFSLGLDSISAIQFSNRLKDAGIANLPVSVILKNPTIARLCAAHLTTSRNPRSSKKRTGELSGVLSVELRSRVRADFEMRGLQVQKIMPCTPLQEAMLSSLSSSSDNSYCNTMVFKIIGNLVRLQGCWLRMFERHEILRTTFVPTDDSSFAFAQVVLEHSGLEWDDLSPDQNVSNYASMSLSRLLESNKPPVQLAVSQNGESITLIFCCHHALYDGVAMATLLNDIERAYVGEALSIPIPYENFLRHAVFQDTEAADHFWQSSLAGMEPSFFPRLSGQLRRTSTSSSFHQTSQMSLGNISNFCQMNSVSLLPVVQAAWAKLLHFYLGTMDLCFGNVVSGRTLPERDLERLIAPCFNTLPVRLSFEFENSNADMIRQLHRFNIDSLPYQLTPLRRIQTKVLNDGGRLFDTLLILQQPNAKLNGSIWILEEDTGSLDLPIVCEVLQNPDEDSLTIKLHYQDSLMTKSDAKIVAETFDHALSSLIRYPQAAARDTVGFPSDILAQSNLNFTYLSSSEGLLLHSTFEKNAELHPNSVALDFQHADGGGTLWKYKELNAMANRIAHALIERNIEPNDIVPVHIPKSPQFYASILGVLKAGAAFSPINPDLPESRKRVMLSELQPKVVLYADNFSPPMCNGVAVLDVDTTDKHHTINPIVHGLVATNLAYCLYTSGSTGTPKAVSMDHRSPLQTVGASKELIPWKHNSRLLQYASTSFDMCYYDCFIAWSFGFTLCSSEQDAMLNDITGTIQLLNVDLLDLTPSVAASLKRDEVPSVKWLYCIGEAMTPEVIRNWDSVCVNSYGPTEAAFCTTIFPVRSDISANVIGKPFPTTSFAVFPTSGERVLPAFGVGELYIGGTQLARGYYGKSELTEEKFVHRNGQRFYKSGDLVRMLGDGNFEFIGRVDDQVKIRGLRVELGEINHVIRTCDERISAVTTQILKKDKDMKDQLVAFLEIKCRDDKAAQSEVRDKAKHAAVDSLPAYMVPQFYLFVGSVPKSAAGKIDKVALTKIFRQSEYVTDFSNNATAAAVEHEWTKTESQIRDIFAKLSSLPTKDIYCTTSIYQLGLDSISAVQIATALRKRGFNASAVDVLKHTNCQDLAARLESSGSQARLLTPQFNFKAFEMKFRSYILETLRLEDSTIEAIRPCTPLQEGMISQFIAKDGAIYFNYIQLRLDLNVDLSKLQESWRMVVAKHEMLRTGFAHVKDKTHHFAMIHYKSEAFSLPWQDLSQADSVSSVDGWLAQVGHNTSKRLDQPSWQIRVTQTSGEIYLDLAIFHALFDAHSIRVIFNDVSAAYKGVPSGPPKPLGSVVGVILDQSSDRETQRSTFWKDLGRMIVPTRFPNLAPLRYAPAAPAVISKLCTTSLVGLETLCRKSNITLQAVGIASWATLLSEYTGERSVACGIVLSGRSFEAAESAVFPCITTVPFACAIDDDKAKMLKDIMKLSVEVQRYQFTPLNEIQRLMGYPNEQLFDSLFTFQKLSNNEEQINPWILVDEKATIEYPISIELVPVDKRLELRLTYVPHIIPEAQADLMLEQLDHLIKEFAHPDSQSPTRKVYDPVLYSVTPAKESSLPSDVTLLHQFVEFSAHKYPNHVAFEFATSIGNDGYSSKRWTYTEFNAEGNRVANLLVSHGIHPGGLVGVCFDKCPEASFAMLGILKAGCAFVALDPGAPIARRAFIVKDSGADIVLSLKAQSAGLLKVLEAEILNLDDVDMRLLSSSKPSLERHIDAKDRSYCLYTSGTTGSPKGCEITHENAVQALLSFQRIFTGHWDSTSRWLQFASFHFDVSVLEQYWSWSVGICVVSAPRDLILVDLATAITVLGITHIDLTPSLARILHPEDVPSLCKGVFITGGESLKQEIIDTWGPKGVIYNGYGPTEATIGVTMYPRVPANGKPSNIGTQFDNVGSYVLKPFSDRPVLRGGVGELCVSGKLVGKGYLNRPELTEERFARLSGFDERVYRTGDLVRILHDCTFDFLGRADDQVKLRGQRLEIGEINAVIKQSVTDISDVATLVLKHPKQQKDQLVSFVVTASRAKGEPKAILEYSSSLDKLRNACQDSLPGYMIPTHFVALSAMPLSANNKIDARRLKEMYEALSVADLQMLAGVTNGEDEEFSKEERRIRDVLADMLQMDADNIKRTSSLFELGLDSVSVIGFSKALKQAGFAKSTVSLLMKNTSVSRLSKALIDNRPASDASGSIIAAQQAITAIQHRHRRDVAEALFMDSRNIEALAPCTPLQQGMIARSLESEQGLYFNSFHFKLIQDVDDEILQNAWEKAFTSIPILRTMFSNTEDGFVQAVVRRLKLPWNYCSLSNDAVLDGYLKQLKKQWWQGNKKMLKKPFELHLVATPTQKVLVVHIFHALYDGISIGLVFKMLWDIYSGATDITAGPPFHSVLAHGPLRPAQGVRDFWRNRISDNAFHPFPAFVDKPTEGPVTVARTISSLIGYELLRRRLSVTPQAVAQACWATVLHRYTKGVVTLGIVVSGRSIDYVDADRVIGPMFNTIPYQHRVQRKESWTSIIKRTHDFNIAAHPYQHTPLRDIMKWVKHNPGQSLFDTLFVYQTADDNEVWTKNSLWELQDGGAEADYPLALEVEQRGDASLQLTLVAQGHVLDNKSSDQLLEAFEITLKSILEDPDAVWEMPFTSEGLADEASVLIEHNASSARMSDVNDFKWTTTAKRVKEEIVNLAGADNEDVNEKTSIFELGLDSIDAIKLSLRLKKVGIDLPVSAIMRGLTVSNMVKNIFNSKPTWNQQPSDMIFKYHKRRLESYVKRRLADTNDIEKALPLTPLQEAMVAEMVSSKYTRYYNHDILKLSPEVDLDRLRRAWVTVVKKSPILRTSFIEVDDPSLDFSFAQIVHNTPHDFSRHEKIDSEPDFPKIVDSIRNAAVATAQSSPLFHIHFMTSPKGRFLVLSIAHALYDGWSLGLLHSDLHHAYHDQVKPRPDYDFALLNILSSSGSDAAAFWRDFLSGTKFAPFQRRSNYNVSRQAIHRDEQRSSMSLAELTSFVKKNKISLQALGQTAYALVLASYVHSLDVTFGSILSGRDSERLSEIMFPTMNTVAIRTILHGSLREMVHYVQENLNNIKQWQHFPLRKAQALAGVRGPLFESLFIYQKSLKEDEAKHIKLYESIEGHSDVEYPVCVEMEIANDQFMWRCAVKEELFDKAGAKDLLNTLDLVLRVIVTQPDSPTIDFTPSGTSICCLPAFRDEPYPEPDNTMPATEIPVTYTPHSATAKLIRETLAFVSKTPEEEITEDMTIFHIGLDSISAIKVSSLLRKCGIVLSVGEMLKAGTVEKMAQVVDKKTRVATEHEEDADALLKDALSSISQARILRDAGIKEADVEQIIPATAAQTYMLSLWVNSKGASFYPKFLYHTTGEVSIEELQRSWKALTAANPILRTGFLAMKDSRFPYVQAIFRATEAGITDVTESAESGSSQYSEKHTLAQPYTHLFVRKLSNGWDLRLHIHHALYDGVSLPLLVQQFQDLLNGTKPDVPSYDTFKQFVAVGATSSALQSRKSFWSRYLRHVEQRWMPQPASTPTLKMEIFKRGLLPDIRKLESEARKRGITTQSLFLASYAKLYHRLTSTSANEDVIIGIYLANRSQYTLDISQAAIPTVNLVPLRVSAPLKTEIWDVASQIQYDIREISSPVNSAVSLYEIADWTGIQVDTFVNFLNLPDTTTEETAAGNDKIKITQTKQWEEHVSRVTKLTHHLGESPKELINERIGEAYLHAIDVEVTHRNGALDVGVFAPEAMLNLKHGEELVQDIKRELEGLIANVKK